MGGVNVKRVMIETELGPRPFTDICIEIDGEWYGARMHGNFTNEGVKAYVADTTRRRKKPAPLLWGEHRRCEEEGEGL